MREQMYFIWTTDRSGDMPRRSICKQKDGSIKIYNSRKTAGDIATKLSDDTQDKHYVGTMVVYWDQTLENLGHLHIKEIDDPDSEMDDPEFE